MSGIERFSDDTVRAAAEGARSETERLLAALLPQVRAMVTARLSVNPAHFDAVEEISQSAMISVAEAIRTLQERTVAGLNALVSVIVSRRVIDYLRQKGRAQLAGRRVASLDTTVAYLSGVAPLWTFLSAGGPSPLSALRQADQVSVVLDELGRLKEEHREVIVFALFDQLTTSEIGRRLEISRRAASMLLLRAIRSLRDRVMDASQTRRFHDRPE